MPANSPVQIAPVGALPIDVAPAVSVLQVAHATRSFALPQGGVTLALRDVSLQVRKGEVLGLIGHGGAGKTTLLRVMNLLDRPDRGHVTLAGRELTTLGERELRAARQDIGMVFQACHLMHKLTVIDNVAFPLRLHGRLNAPRLAARVGEVLELAGIAELAARYPGQLSSAQRQRVAIARALVNHPLVLLCDAPVTGLDPEAARAIFDTLDTINRELGVALVIASHELALLGAVCNRVAVLDQGMLAEQFDTADTSRARDTALGRELAYYSSEAYAACSFPGAAHA